MEPVVEEAIAVLERTPETLRGLLADLPEPWLARFEGEETFGPRDVLGHLIHGEKTDWPPRIKLILEVGESRPFEPFDRRGFERGDEPPSVEALLDEFAACRASSLVDLRGHNLREEQLRLKGTHPELGTVTLGQLLATWVVHDLNHIGQIVRVMSARYAEAVGPWRPYLGVLNRSLSR